MRINPYAIVLMLNFPLSLFLITTSQKTKLKTEKYEKTTNDTSACFIDSTFFIR